MSARNPQKSRVHLTVNPAVLFRQSFDWSALDSFVYTFANGVWSTSASSAGNDNFCRGFGGSDVDSLLGAGPGLTADWELFWT